MKPNHETPSKDSSVNKVLALKLRGILLPFTTPFDLNEDLDIAGLGANIQYWNSTGICGYVALGSTGERVNLDEREMLAVVEAARAEVTEDLAFIVGAGQQSTRQTIAEIRKVSAAGADAVLVITPSFYRPAITPAALVAHYTAVADASPVPIILYSMPDLTGIALEPDTVAQLSEHSNIIGIKDSSADMARFEKTLKAVADDFTVLTGNGTVLHPALCVGAAGGILAVGCVAAEQCLEIYRAVESEDDERGAALQQKLTPLALAVTKRYGIGGLKTALDFVGLKGGNVRSPLKLPDEAARQEIADLLRSVVNLKVDSDKPFGFAGAFKT